MNDLVTTISSLLSAVQSFIWGPPMIILLLGLGLLLTLKLRVLQLRKLTTTPKVFVAAMVTILTNTRRR